MASDTLKSIHFYKLYYKLYFVLMGAVKALKEANFAFLCGCALVLFPTHFLL